MLQKTERTLALPWLHRLILMHTHSNSDTQYIILIHKKKNTHTHKYKPIPLYTCSPHSKPSLIHSCSVRKKALVPTIMAQMIEKIQTEGRGTNSIVPIQNNL